MLVNYRITLQYDGSRYNGWQKQGNTRNTIQGRLEELLSKYFEQPVEVNGSGRTDAGVHALGQVANFKVELPEGYRDEAGGEVKKEAINETRKKAGKKAGNEVRGEVIAEVGEAARDEAERSAAGDKAAGESSNESAEKVMNRLNSYLPEDIRIIHMEIADVRFHARLNAVSKEYRYYVSLDRKKDVFGRKYMAALEKPERLDINRMRDAARKLVGEHDFQGFSDNRSNKSTIRRIDSIDIGFKGRDEDCVEFVFRGNGFLYHMVRLIVGTLLSIGVGDSDAGIIEEIFDSRDRHSVPFMAPAEGLFLYAVYYV